MPEKPERTSYTPLDFRVFRETNSLEIAPKFQRRPVWKTPARSYFIDTLIRGYPVPPIYLRVRQSEDSTRTIREVIDGQQRIRAVLEFMDGEFALTGSLDSAWSGRRFADLEDYFQDAIREYPLNCEVLHGVSDAKVLEVFARLNTYSVRLNAQELRNGTYFGYFKQLAYSLSLEHIEFWRQNRIMTESQIARMVEAELTSELMVVLLDGLQDKKKSLNRFYADFDEVFPKRDRVESRFRTVMDEISDALGDTLGETEFRRRPLFYSLFSAIAHRTFGVKGVQLTTPKRRLRGSERESLQDSVLKLSDVIRAAREEESYAARYVPFVNASLRQTDNLIPRRARLTEIYRSAF